MPFSIQGSAANREQTEASKSIQEPSVLVEQLLITQALRPVPRPPVLLVDEHELSHGLKRYARAAPKLSSSAHSWSAAEVAEIPVRPEEHVPRQPWSSDPV